MVVEDPELPRSS